MHGTNGKGKRIWWMALAGLVGLCVYFIAGGTPLVVAQQAQPGGSEIIHPKTYPLTMDPGLGVPAAHLGVGKLHQMDVTIIEIPPGGSTPPHRHLAEEMDLIISGSGYTQMWPRAEVRKERYDWKEGDLLSPSLNVWHQHFNSSQTTPARLVVVTTAPLTENLFHNAAFLTSSDFQFEDRWKQGVTQKPEYVPVETYGPENVTMKVGHLLPNLRNRELRKRSRDMLGITISPVGDMAANQLLEMEIREFTATDGTTPEHRHVWETVYYILKGDGYVTLQKGDQPERRLDWAEGDLFLVEANEYHNHRPRSVGGRFIQIKPSGYFHRVGLADDFTMQNNPNKKIPVIR
jgi:quercetin dioxygenase-like cupin family protein